MDIRDTKIGRLFSLRAKAEEIHRELPLHMLPEIDMVSRGLPQYGPHLLSKKGPGTEFFEIRDFNPQTDDRRRIHPRHTQKRGKEMFVEKEAEIRHHFYMWRDSTASMAWKSAKAPFTPKEAAEILMFALTKHLTRNHEKVGLLETGEILQGHQAMESLTAQLAANDFKSDKPHIQRKLVPGSSAILLGDFLSKPLSLPETLGRLRAMEIGGWVIMIEDPEIFDFSLKADVIEGPEGETPYDGCIQRKDYQRALKEHIELIQDITQSRGFQFILQRTDEPLGNSLRALYRLGPRMPESVQKLGL